MLLNDIENDKWEFKNLILIIAYVIYIEVI